MKLQRSEILGSWELMSFTARAVDTGQVSHPLGHQPRGLIVYTHDGYMSAQLTGGRAGQDPAGPGFADYVAYGGRFHVDEASATIRHEVTISMLPELLTQPQLRHASLEGDRLTLSATATNEKGTATESILVWRRAPPAGRAVPITEWGFLP